MNCFNHTNDSANAICKNCGKAICANCISLIEGKVCCKNICEIEQKKMNDMTRLSFQAFSKSSTVLKRSAFFTGSLGFLFILLGVVPYFINGQKGMLLFCLIGVVFIVNSFFSYKSGKSYVKDSEV